MGIDSFRIFTICHCNDSSVIENVEVDFTNIEHLPEIQYVESIGLKVDGIKKFNDIFYTSYGHLRIFGYLDNDAVRMWNKFYDIIFEQNPQVYDIQAHFWCSDERKPFVIRKKRKYDNIRLFIGNENDVLYTKVDYSIDPNDESPTSFDEEKYINLVKIYPKIFWYEMHRYSLGYLC